MSRSSPSLSASNSRALNRPAPPIPTPRSTTSSSSPLTAKASGITVRKQKTPKPTKSEDAESKLVQMNEEILRYRIALRDNSENQNRDSPTDSSSAKTDEIKTLKQDLQDVLEKNSHWQVYNDQREEYVRGLHEKYNTLHHQYQHMQQKISSLTNTPTQLSEQQRKHYDSLLVQARQQLETSREETTKLKKELDDTKVKFEEEKLDLKREMEHWRNRYEQEKVANMNLQKESEKEHRRRHPARGSNKENWDEIVLLRKEMEKCREEFRSERKRREDIEHRLSGLQRKFRDSEISPQKKKSQHLIEYERDRPRTQITTRYTNQNFAISPPKVKKISTSIDKPHTKHHKERNSYPSQPGQCSSRLEKSHRDRSTRKSEDRTEKPAQNRKLNQTYSEFGHHCSEELQCPNCGKLYGVEEHEFLLIHIDSCV